MVEDVQMREVDQERDLSADAQPHVGAGTDDEVAGRDRGAVGAAGGGLLEIGDRIVEGDDGAADVAGGAFPQPFQDADSTARSGTTGGAAAARGGPARAGRFEVGHHGGL